MFTFVQFALLEYLDELVYDHEWTLFIFKKPTEYV